MSLRKLILKALPMDLMVINFGTNGISPDMRFQSVNKILFVRYLQYILGAALQHIFGAKDIQ
jgi:hypothetical protein